MVQKRISTRLGDVDWETKLSSLMVQDQYRENV